MWCDFPTTVGRFRFRCGAVFGRRERRRRVAPESLTPPLAAAELHAQPPQSTPPTTPPRSPQEEVLDPHFHTPPHSPRCDVAYPSPPPGPPYSPPIDGTVQSPALPGSMEVEAHVPPSRCVELTCVELQQCCRTSCVRVAAWRGGVGRIGLGTGHRLCPACAAEARPPRTQ